MKVKDLIRELKKLEPELTVVVDGYEDGFTANVHVRKIAAYLQFDSARWEGEYTTHHFRVDKSSEKEEFINISRHTYHDNI